MSLSLSLYLSIFFGHVMSSNHSEQMSQRSQVSRIALRRCSQNVFVFVFGHVVSSIITLNKCLKGHKSLGLHLGGVLKMSVFVFVFVFVIVFVFVFVNFFGHVMSSHHSDQMSQRSLGQLKRGWT